MAVATCLPPRGETELCTREPGPARPRRFARMQLASMPASVSTVPSSRRVSRLSPRSTGRTADSARASTSSSMPARRCTPAACRSCRPAVMPSIHPRSRGSRMCTVPRCVHDRMGSPRSKAASTSASAGDPVERPAPRAVCRRIARTAARVPRVSAARTRESAQSSCKRHPHRRSRPPNNRLVRRATTRAGARKRGTRDTYGIHHRSPRSTSPASPPRSAPAEWSSAASPTSTRWPNGRRPRHPTDPTSSSTAESRGRSSRRISRRSSA